MKKLFLFLISFYAFGQDNINSEFNNLELSRIDERFAQILNSFFLGLSRGEYDKKVLLALNSLVDRSDAFNDFRDLVNLSATLNCNDLIKNPHNQSSKFGNKWVNELKKYCRIQILTRITQGKLEKEEEDLFFHALPKLLQGESKSTFIEFLSNMRNDKTLGQKILDYISKSIILLKIIPPEDIIKQLKLNKELTAFFQQENVLKKNHESIFLKEFKITFIRLLSKHGFNLQASDNPALNFLKNNQPYLPPDGIYRSLKSIGYEQLRAKKDNAKELYRICHELSPPDKKLESNFFLIWPSIYMNNYPEVVRIIKQTNMLENFDSYNPNLKFWIAYSFQKNNELILAKSFYQKIIQQNHLDYYSIISIKALKSLSPSFNPLTILENTKSFTTPSTYKLNDLKKSYISTIRRALLWLDQGREDFYKMEIDTLLEAELSIALKLDAGIKQKSFKTWLVLNLLSMLNNKGYYLNTFKLAFDSLDKDFIYFSLPLLKTLFPMSYFSKIKEIESGVDPIITLSLIRQESAFNPRARSIAGATGLMQLLPSTAQFLNGKIKKNQLHNPDINLSLGILYLEKLLKKYNGNLIYSLSAYNAGEKRLGTWIKEYFLNQDPVVIVESIPFEETKNYVKLIYRNIFFYKYLSNDTGAFLPVEDSFSVFPSH